MYSASMNDKFYYNFITSLAVAMYLESADTSIVIIGFESLYAGCPQFRIYVALVGCSPEKKCRNNKCILTGYGREM